MNPISALLSVPVALWTVTHVMEKADIDTIIKEHGLVPVQSSVDGNVYSVMNTSYKHKAADLLATAATNARRVVAEVEKIAKSPKALASYPEHIQAGIARLQERLPNKKTFNFMEMNPFKNRYLAFNRNKGKGIFICLLRNKDALNDDEDDDGTLVLADDDVVTFIALHELAHTMTDNSSADPSDQHDDMYFEMEHFLYSIAKRLKIMNPKAVNGKGHCSKTIKHPRPDLLP